MGSSPRNGSSTSTPPLKSTGDSTIHEGQPKQEGLTLWAQEMSSELEGKQEKLLQSSQVLREAVKATWASPLGIVADAVRKFSCGLPEKEQGQLIDALKQVEAAAQRQHRKRFGNNSYGIVWDRSASDFDEALNNDFVALQHLESESIREKGGPFKNLLIEGDNFDTLRYLRMTHYNKVDVIYIDPPYNTGGDGFIYNDRFPHSIWLEFMHQRLSLAKDLLKCNGTIFLSIDIREYAQLKLLCDKIFGEKKHLGTLSWVKKTKPVNSGKARFQIQQKVEFVLVYSMLSKDEHPGFLLKEAGGRKYNYPAPLGMARLLDLDDSNLGQKQSNTMRFPIRGITPASDRRWKIGLDKYNELEKSDRIVVVNGKPKQIVYPEDDEANGNSVKFSPFWSHLDCGTAENGKATLTEILGPHHRFDTVKPVDLLKGIFSHFPNDILVLDFFAGSGTTAHALLEMNKEDGGGRRFILATNNQGDICSDICAPRVRKVIQGYQSSSVRNKLVEGVGGDMAYLRVEKICHETANIDLVKSERVWVTMQLMLLGSFSPFDASKQVQITEHEGSVVAFIPSVSKGSLSTLIAALAETNQTPVVWTLDAVLVKRELRKNNLNAIVQKIPTFIIDAFEGRNPWTKYGEQK